MKKCLLLSITVVSALLMSSCVDLNINPLSEGSSENWYSSKQEFEMSVSDFYTSDFFPISDNRWDGDVVHRNNFFSPFNGSITAEDATIASRWKNYYTGIARALKIINNIDKAKELGLTDAEIKQYSGEAYFYMGFAYGMIAFYWGDAILDKTGMTLEEAYTASRSPKAEILAFSYECLDKAAENLPAKYSGIQKATKGAAYAFKARIALYNGDYQVAATAAKKCMDLDVYKLHSNYEDLFTTSWSDEWIFFFKGDVALKQYYFCAVGWQIQNYLSRNAGGWGAACAPSLELVCAYPCTDGKPIDESPLYDTLDFFRNRDPRMAMTIQPFATKAKKEDPSYNWKDYVFMGFEYDPSPLALKVHKADGTLVQNNDSKANAMFASVNGFMFRKYIYSAWTENGYGGAPNAYPYLRYGDVLLMYAEAMNELGKCDQTVLDQTINLIRERAYAGTGISYPKAATGTQSALRTLIRTERYIEMAFEGHRLEDLYRWKLAEKVFNTPVYYMPFVWSGTAGWNGDTSTVSESYKALIENWNKGCYPIGGIPDIDENGIADISSMEKKGYVVKAVERRFDPTRDYLWPIPAADRLINPNLTQNPGY